MSQVKIKNIEDYTLHEMIRTKSGKVQKVEGDAVPWPDEDDHADNDVIWPTSSSSSRSGSPQAKAKS